MIKVARFYPTDPNDPPGWVVWHWRTPTDREPASELRIYDP